MSIWSEQQLNQWGADAESQINQDLQCIWQRCYLSTNSGLSVYTLPNYIRSIVRITWRGKKIEPLNWEDLQSLAPASAFVAPFSTDNIDPSQSRPMYYAFHPTNIYDIRFYPTPNESFGQGTDPYSVDIGPYCILSYWRSSDNTFQDQTAVLPKYIDRRTRKAYVAHRAFMAEGPGQNLKMGQYYKQKYQFLIDKFKSINEYVYLSQRYSLDDGSSLSMDNMRYPKPVLPARFERT